MRSWPVRSMAISFVECTGEGGSDGIVRSMIDCNISLDTRYLFHTRATWKLEYLCIWSGVNVVADEKLRFVAAEMAHEPVSLCAHSESSRSSVSASLKSCSAILPVLSHTECRRRVASFWSCGTLAIMEMRCSSALCANDTPVSNPWNTSSTG